MDRLRAPQYIETTAVRRPGRGRVLLASALLTAACSGAPDRDAQPAGQSSAATSTAAAEAPFSIGEDWADMPVKAPVEVAQKTEEQCYDSFWEDAEGKRAPAVQEDPLVVFADGSCNTPLDSDVVGMYTEPTQGSQVAATLHNMVTLGVECWTTGEPIQDIRGAASRSDVWLGVVVMSGGKQIAGFVPETNAGYVDEARIEDRC